LDVLVIEDDEQTREFLKFELDVAGIGIVAVESLADARDTLAKTKFNVVVVDRMLPDGDGISFVEQLRSEGDETPVLVLSALGDVHHRVEGLRAGGDDYLVKPFDIVELTARLEGLVRRATNVPTTSLQIGDLNIDLLTQRVIRADQEIRLQPKEYKLLEYLALRCDQVVTRTMLLEAVWGISFDPQTNVVDVHISRLRNKLESGFKFSLLHTVRGQGYRLAQAP